jgi:hypothetical protein
MSPFKQTFYGPVTVVGKTPPGFEQTFVPDPPESVVPLDEASLARLGAAIAADPRAARLVGNEGEDPDIRWIKLVAVARREGVALGGFDAATLGAVAARLPRL